MCLLYFSEQNILLFHPTMDKDNVTTKIKGKEARIECLWGMQSVYPVIALKTKYITSASHHYQLTFRKPDKLPENTSESTDSTVT